MLVLRRPRVGGPMRDIVKQHHPSCPRRDVEGSQLRTLIGLCPCEEAALDLAREEVDVEYVWKCFGTITCEPILDQHGRECDHMNDEARSEFYLDLAARALSDAVIEALR